jgi:hypothetical protein
VYSPTFAFIRYYPDSMEPSYTIRRISPPAEEISLGSAIWNQANEIEISHFHPRSSDHHPRTRVRALHDSKNIFVRFEVDDRYVISKLTQYQDMVCFDSCVEFFFRPKKELGYFNLEINCGGTFLFYYVEDPTPTPTGLAKFTRVNPEQANQIKILHSMPPVVFPERTEPTCWSIGCRIPLSVLTHYIGAFPDPAKSPWDGNFYKCADHSSHPHWASWSPLGDKLNFHLPEYFARLGFE